MVIRAIQPSDADEWLRMRMALWPDSTPAAEAASFTFAMHLLSQFCS